MSAVEQLVFDKHRNSVVHMQQQQPQPQLHQHQH
jgi:hypothetical protein